MTPRKKQRETIDGVLLLDKPRETSSNDALVRVRRLLNARKGGHGGTLDPMATGLLPLLFGEATKFAHDSLDADKTYLAELTLGVDTETGDAEGPAIRQREVRCDEAQLRAAANSFVGGIDQVPPMHSALKRDGRPLYEYARAGVTLEREARHVTIHSIDVLRFESPRVQFRVRCSKGTYVRTLATDIGERLGCGAHLSSLRRERVGSLDIADAITPAALEALDAARRLDRLLPVDALLAGLPRVELDVPYTARFLQGQKLRVATASGPACPAVLVGAGESAAAGPMPRVRVYGSGRLLGVARIDDATLVPQRLIATDTKAAEGADNGINA